MNANTVFAVVDLETTGNNTHDDNRIIQFSCTLVQNNKIIRVYSTDVNSETKVPARITKLTGITNAELKSAPTFAEVADKIYKMLSGTVFVAHNVNFDFPFLNQELKRVGHLQLPIKAIDTVTLSQILLPMVPSYRLRDLTSYFNIVHDHPHAASSDAIATAHLFLVLVKRLKTLPLQTLKSIMGLNLQLPKNTAQLIQSIYQSQVHVKQGLPDHLMSNHGLVLRRFNRNHRQLNKQKYSFPFNDHQKMDEFDHQIKFIPEQVKLMNLIYENYRNSQPDNLFVATNKGMGKKFGYGLPLAYLSHNRNQKIIVSLGSQDSEIDFVNKTVPVIKQLAPFPVSFSILKSANNYIDLNRFFVSLRVVDQSTQFQFMKAQVLVWLTMTTTGDLSELSSVQASPFVNEINHRGIKSIRPSQPFYRVDFLRRARNYNKYSNLLITTHDYLLMHAKQISQQNQKPFLVIDNALELPNSILRANKITISLNHINVLIRKLQGTIKNTHTLSVIDIVGHQKQFKKSLRHIMGTLDKITNSLAAIQKRVSTRFLGREFINGSDNHLHGIIDGGKLKDECNFERPRFAEIQKNWKACFENANRIIAGPKQGYSLAEQSVIDHFQSLTLEMTREIKMNHEFLKRIQQDSSKLLISVTANQVHDYNNAFLTEEGLSPEHDLQEALYKYFPPVLFVDNLRIDSRVTAFTFDRLGLSAQNKRLIQINSNLPLYPLTIVDNSPILSDNYGHEAVNYYVNLLLKLLSDGPKKTFILFNSKQLLRRVYFALTEKHVGEHYNLMAEDISGNRAKLIKNILNDGQLMVLGSIETLKISHLVVRQFAAVLIADLPMIQDDSQRNHFILEQIQQTNHDSFNQFELPNAILKLNQELALTDRNQFVAILDSRIIKKPFGRVILNSLTNQFTSASIHNERLLFAIANFFKNFVKK
ncbi:hypothetical protein MOO44_06915 [Nicoliella spurrieriana]|uniref:DNA polymerase III polC-type n=1 Tax=Nicoliella spurrieriana TaxID=2925830 RepID=A0A976RTU4_9LACO|nr:exonuclease domain-containing protein [Nicoliella spurrieriana]UQS87514.1 hypothetical protein MOO44_06915 [Nicoliella spurrieriana]